MPDKDPAGFDNEKRDQPHGGYGGSENPLRPDGEAIAGLCEQVERFVAEKPLRALAVAFVAGLVFGRIVL